MTEKPYSFGSVWVITLIKVQHGMCDQYLRDIVPVRKRLMDEAFKEGVILSHKMFHGYSSGSEDWDTMIMVEYPNWGALDGLPEKLEAVNRAVIGSEIAAVKAMESRAVSRTMVGDKVMQEVVFE